MGDPLVRPAEAEAPALSFPERLMGVFISPGETFADVTRKPGFWAPLITLVVAAAAVSEIMVWKIGMERMVRMSLEQSGRASKMTPEQMDLAVRQGAHIGAIFAHIAPFVFLPLYLLLVAGLGILAVNLIFGAKTNFKTVFSLVSYANLIALLGSLMSIAVIFFGDPDHFNSQNPVPSNLGFFLNPTQVSKPLYALSTSADILTIWTVILMAMALSEGTGRKVKTLPIFLVYAGLWAVWILVKMGLSMLG